jgi:hypothetical protein
MISRRRLRLVITLLLPLLALRALLPTGYMVATDGGVLRIVPCDAGIAAHSAAAAGHGHHHQHHHGDPDPQPTGGLDCPFALAAVHAPPPPLVSGVPVPVPHFTFVSRTSEQLPPGTGPPRQANARAPPLS